MIQNLTEDFLYERLPEGLVELDERGLIQAVVGGYQDRLEDLRSYSKKLELLFQTSGLPETGDNVVLVDIQSEQGKVYTRSLDIESDTPEEGTAALTTWVLDQLGEAVNADNVSNIRYGRDLLRLVDANTLDYLATTIGAVLYQSSALSTTEQTTASQQILQTYFPRLKFKGTAKSFEALGRILGFDDVKVTPLWGRLNPRVPNDIGSPSNDADFDAEPEYDPQQQIDDFYNPLKTNDGPFYSWSGTAAPGTASTSFITQAVNGFNPWVNAEILDVRYGTVTLPSAGSYALAEGAPHRKAYVESGDVRFEAVGEGEYFNGIEIHVADSGTNKVLSITDRLSAIKYRSSYFDLALTAEFDRVEELYGSSAMKRNKDLAANPTLTGDGTAASPYRPWTSGSVTTGLVYRDFLVETGTNSPSVVTARVQASGTNRQLNVDELLAAGVQVTQALEEVRPATRQARRSGIGFLIRDEVGYAAYTKETTLFTTTASPNYSGSNAEHPIDPFYTLIALQSGTNEREMAQAVVDPLNPDGYLFKSTNFVGTYDFSSGSYFFSFPLGATSGTNVIALWKVPSSEVIRTEPASGTNKAYQARPEDQENGNLDEVADDMPWRRDLTLGGELVDATIHNPITPDALVEAVDPVMSVPGHDGAEYNVYGINSTSGILRLTTAARSIGSDYAHGMMATAYKGTLKNLASVTDRNGETDLERLFDPGAELYTAGVVQGVVVADPNKFYSPAHRTGLVGWFPFNEHVDDNLAPVDRSAAATNLSPIGLSASARQWDDDRGWYLKPTNGSILSSEKVRLTGSRFSISFWIKPGDLTTETDLLTYGPLKFTWNGSALEAYWTTVELEETLVGAIYPSGFTFVCLTMRGTDITMGYGDLSTPVALWHAFGDWAGFEDTDEVLRLQGTDYGISDLRLWDEVKTEDELNSIRYYEPTATQAAYQVGTFLNLNHRDRYALKVLPCGLCAAAPLPGWYTMPRLAFVSRYDSLGRYEGESRFKEVGVGGGQTLPSTFTLGQQFYNLTADGQTVVSTPTGALPGENEQWLDQEVPPIYLRVYQTGSDSYDTWVSSGTSTPWPNKMVATNPGRDAVWVLGDDNLMYEVSLESSGTTAALTASLIARERSDEELEISGFGTEDWDVLRYSEQPTGAQTILATDGTVLAVAFGGSAVYQKSFSGTYDTPPLYLYLNSRVITDVENAWEQWTEKDNDAEYGNSLTPPLAARDENGVLEFTNTGAIVPGNYRLTVVSGNIGKVDSDFDGFAVEITVDATLLDKRLCSDETGYNFTGTDTFEFEIENGVEGEWLMSFDWRNALTDDARGTARRLAIYSYKLERITTELYEVAINTTGSDPLITQVDVGTYSGTTPGGWLASVNSYGSVASWAHESQVYPTIDTLTSKLPLSEILTATTIERREDILGPTNVVLTDGTTTAMPSFGSIVDAGTGYAPLWFWSGAVTGDSVVLAAKMPTNAAALRFAVSEYGTIGSDAIYSDYLVADDSNFNTVKAKVEGLRANKTYYYAMANAGSIASGFIGRFKTWDETTRNFTFALGSCARNKVALGVNPVLFDTIRAKDPLFFLHTGDMNYNDDLNPNTEAMFHESWDKVFELSARQKEFWQNLAVPYIWDDHDYGMNDGDTTFAARSIAREVFQRIVPHYPLPGGEGDVGIYHSFSVGRCYFIVTDNRSCADPISKTDGPDKTRLGATQKAWLKQQLLFARDNYAVTFLVMPTTWGGAASAGSDTWAGYATERTEIIDFIVANSISNIFLLSGDAHSAALDDGTNNAFGTGGTGGMVILQAAPLQNLASRKGTPYTEGPYPASGSATKNQYGMVTVWDDGTNVPYLTFQAFDDTSGADTELFSLSFYGTESPKP